jgi:hypothetical protein
MPQMTRKAGATIHQEGLTARNELVMAHQSEVHSSQMQPTGPFANLTTTLLILPASNCQRFLPAEFFKTASILFRKAGLCTNVRISRSSATTAMTPILTHPIRAATYSSSLEKLWLHSWHAGTVLKSSGKGSSKKIRDSA